MVTESYQNALKEMVWELVNEIIDDAVGVAVSKERRGKVYPTKLIDQYGTCDSPSDLGSPLSTFSSTHNTSPGSAVSPITPSFDELANSQITDNEAKPAQAKTPERKSKDDELVKYLIGEISESEDENQQADSIACTNTQNKNNTNLNSHAVKITEADTTNLHDTNTARTLMVPINANVIVETIAESKKNDNQVASKDKKKIKGRNKTKYANNT